MRLRTAWALGAPLALVSLAASCGGDSSSDPAPASAVASTADGAATSVPSTTAAPEDSQPAATEAPTSAPTPPEPERRLPDMTVDQAAPGSNPLLTWTPIEGAALYRVAVLDPDGQAYWAWSGTSTSVAVGGNETPTLVGARIFGDMTWRVSAHGADGTPLAMSDRQPLSP